MTARMQRTQILLEPEQHRALTELASVEGHSLSDIVREFVAAQLAQRARDRGAQRQRQLAGLEQIRAHRQAIRLRRGALDDLPDPSQLIDQLRDERDAELTTISDRH